jgi:hypothetical protein
MMACPLTALSCLKIKPHIICENGITIINKNMHTTSYIAEHCPMCTNDMLLEDMPICSCGYRFPMTYVITYDEEWRYSEELIKRLKGNEGLRLMGKYIGKHAERINEMQNVKYLYLSRYKGFDFRYLQPLEHLNTLELDFTSIVHLEGVDKIPDLKVLSVT